MRMSVAVSDGRTVWAFRYSTEGTPPSLYYSTKVETLRVQYPDMPIFQELSDDSRLIVSEPLGDLVGHGTRFRHPPTGDPRGAGRNRHIQADCGMTAGPDR